jgi:hypothetical protein
MHAYEHLRHRSSKFLVTIEHFAKEGTCIYMNICVTVALDGGVTIELYAKKGKCMHMDICVTVDLFFGGDHRALC